MRSWKAAAGAAATLFLLAAPAAHAGFGSCDSDHPSFMCCLKAAGVDQLKAEADTVLAAASLIDNPVCNAQAGSPAFIALQGGVVAMKAAGLFGDESSCRQFPLTTGAKIIANLLLLIPGLDSGLKQRLADLAQGVVESSLSDVLGSSTDVLLLPYNCACKYSQLSNDAVQIYDDWYAAGKDAVSCVDWVKSVPVIGPLLSGVESGLAHAGTATVDEAEKLLGSGECNAQIPIDQYYRTYWSQWVPKLALMSASARGDWVQSVFAPDLHQTCHDYYHAGPGSCRMSSSNADSNCDAGLPLLWADVAARQQVLVYQALAAAAAVGYGCSQHQGNGLQLDAVGDKAFAACRKLIPAADCSDPTQLCCNRVPRPSAAKCAEARSAAKATTSSFIARANKALAEVPTTGRYTQSILSYAQSAANYQKCMGSIVGDLVPSRARAACDRAAAAQGDDVSGVLPALDQQLLGSVATTANGCYDQWNQGQVQTGCAAECQKAWKTYNKKTKKPICTGGPPSVQECISVCTGNVGAADYINKKCPAGKRDDPYSTEPQ